MRELPVFKGWTVDARLNQFRRIKRQKKHFAVMEYLDFNTVKGNDLLLEYLKTLKAESLEFNEIIAYILDL